MHPTALMNGKRFFDTYVAPLGNVKVVDIGAQDVNGSLKSVCPPQAQYIGVDFVAAKGVDVVLTDPYHLPFESNSLDVVVSSSCFEHSEMFWLLFLEIMRVLKPEGLFYFNSPANGEFHRYPVDCYRFYPDSGNALARWAQRNGLRTRSLESYVSNQAGGHWNDFVSVFLKDEAFLGRHRGRILQQFTDFTNGRMHPVEGVESEVAFVNYSSRQEDQRGTGAKLRRKIARLFGA
jgi:SAM-dependent methyltransferase